MSDLLAQAMRELSRKTGYTPMGGMTGAQGHAMAQSPFASQPDVQVPTTPSWDGSVSQLQKLLGGVGFGPNFGGAVTPQTIYNPYGSGLGKSVATPKIMDSLDKYSDQIMRMSQSIIDQMAGVRQPEVRTSVLPPARTSAQQNAFPAVSQPKMPDILDTSIYKRAGVGSSAPDRVTPTVPKRDERLALSTISDMRGSATPTRVTREQQAVLSNITPAPRDVTRMAGYNPYGAPAKPKLSDQQIAGLFGGYVGSGEPVEGAKQSLPQRAGLGTGWMPIGTSDEAQEKMNTHPLYQPDNLFNMFNYRLWNKDKDGNYFVDPVGGNCTAFAAARAYEAGYPIEAIIKGTPANQWISEANRMDTLRVDNIPEVGTIVAWPAGSPWGSGGHVGFLEAIYPDGSFDMSQSGSTIVPRLGIRAEVIRVYYDNQNGQYYKLDNYGNAQYLSGTSFIKPNY